MNVIMTADDFGASGEINEAVKRAFRFGLLTEASLMVNGEAAAEAISFAKENPQYSFGLHLVLSDGRSTLPPERIPHLVDGQGFFLDSPGKAGLKYFFSKSCHKELQAEIEAQFECFAASGLKLSHVDGHQHLHAHPTIFSLLLPIAEKYGARGIRIPRDDLAANLVYNRHGFGLKLVWRIIFGLLSTWCSRRLAASNLVKTDRVFGLLQTGRMDEKYVVYLLRQINLPAIEIYFHPSLGGKQMRYGPNQKDFEALTSSWVRQAVQDYHIHLSSYFDLKDLRERSP